MDAVVLVDPIGSGEGLKKAVHELGFKIFAIFTRPLSLFEAQFHMTEKELINNCDYVLFSDDLKVILSSVKSHHFKIKAAMTGIDSGSEIADHICDELGLPSNLYELSSARRDKGLMRKLLKEKGFACPDFAICQTEKELQYFIRVHSFPLVVKTPKGAATSHVYVAQSESEALKAFHKIMAEEDFFGLRASSAVIEEYIEGEEYIVNTFSDGSETYVTDMWLYQKIDTKEVQNIYYSAISLPLAEKKYEELQKAGIAISKAFGVLKGPAHLEIKNDRRLGLTLVEIGARLSGTRVPALVQQFTNFDPFKMCVEVFLKGAVQMPKSIEYRKHFAIALCPIFESGSIKKIEGVEAIESLPSFISLQIRVKVGEYFQGTSDLTTIPLTVFLAFENRDQLQKDLDAVHRLFQLKISQS